MKEQLKGSLLLLLGTAIWGCAFVAQSVAMDHIGPFAFQVGRSLLAVLVLSPVAALFDRGKSDGGSYLSLWQDKKLWKTGLLCGLALFVASGAVPVVNTGLFIVGCLLMSDTIAMASGGTNVLTFILVSLVTFNFFIEFAINLLVAPSLRVVYDVVMKSFRRK